MANAVKDSTEAATLSRLRSDPQLAQLAAQVMAESGHRKVALMSQYRQLAESKGLVPDNYAAQWGGNELSVDHQNWWERNGKYVLAATAAVPFAYGIGAAASGGGGAAGGTTAGTGATTSGTTAATGGTAATTGGSTANIVSTQGPWKEYLLKYAVPAAISLGTQAYQSKQANDAIDKAQQAQQAGTDAARAEQQRVTGVASDVYQQQRNDLAPYRDLGGQAFSTLGGLMGFSPSGLGASPTTTPAVRTAPLVQADPAAAGAMTGRHPTENGEMTGRYAGPRGGTLADIQQGAVAQRQSSYGGTQARVKAPNGQVYLIPRERVQEAVANGGQEVG